MPTMRAACGPPLTQMKTSSMCRFSPAVGGSGACSGRNSPRISGTASHRLVGDHNAAFSQEQLDVPQTEGEDVI